MTGIILKPKVDGITIRPSLKWEENISAELSSCLSTIKVVADSMT